MERLAIEDIDKLGPITFKNICETIDRNQGFKRTGAKIRQRFSAVLTRERKSEKDPFGEDIFWPKKTKPRDFIEFRGSEIEGEVRVWNQVPYPEKLGLA